MKDCIFWNKAKSGNGYGAKRVGDRTVGIHRLAYEQIRGEIPEGMVLDHLCRNRNCINIAHLEAVTIKENSRRGKVAKIKENIVAYVRKMYDTGMYTQKHIGDLFFIGQPEVSRIINYKRWS